MIFRSLLGNDVVDWNSGLLYVHKSFSDFDLIWCVDRPQPDMRTSVTSTRSQVKVTELPRLRKLHFSRSISSAVLACRSKLMVDGDSMGPGLQLVGARFSYILLGKLSREFKLSGMSILRDATVRWLGMGILVVVHVLCMLS